MAEIVNLRAIRKRAERQRELDRERHGLQLLNESKYGDFDPPADRWLPFAGVRKNDSYAWELFPQVQGRVRHQLQSALSNVGLQPPSGLDDPRRKIE